MNQYTFDMTDEEFDLMLSVLRAAACDVRPYDYNPEEIQAGLTRLLDTLHETD